jgi:hypothetical protein
LSVYLSQSAGGRFFRGGTDFVSSSSLFFSCFLCSARYCYCNKSTGQSDRGFSSSDDEKRICQFKLCQKLRKYFLYASGPPGGAIVSLPRRERINNAKKTIILTV